MPPRRRPIPAQGGSYTGPWPSETQLLKMGLARCQQEDCSTWLDPVNVRSAKCMSHRSNKPAKTIGKGLV